MLKQYSFCLYTYTNKQTNIYIYMCICPQHTYIHMNVSIYTYTSMHIYRYTCMHIAHFGACAIFSRCNTIYKAGLLPRHYYFLKKTSITLYIYICIQLYI